MANVLASFVSGLVVSGGAVALLNSDMEGKATWIQYKLSKAKATLNQTSDSLDINVPKPEIYRPEILQSYYEAADMLQQRGVPNAKNQWNSMIENLSQKLHSIGLPIYQDQQPQKSA
ncbi:hypothetical protein H4219_000663 [Mycoemilia scoparia]|uniref:MICOS complex subunit MIC13 n=1 Tax=Mycoemilia scoparia TaxID=417184 RepID=A0A9W8DX01_9FUNG|nr:hypothetical protein H4219_000663 [Mycoemilia scoparia]